MLGVGGSQCEVIPEVQVAAPSSQFMKFWNAAAISGAPIHLQQLKTVSSTLFGNIHAYLWEAHASGCASRLHVACWPKRLVPTVLM